ncbi:hypothetical protein [Cytobacillus praedii]|uniref:Uncharacterized protein n=1 Tax=Cytobacillus praedii TaxID=1742358 RepID=A0A4R1AMH4_9BACI|nr:hypothetical protein [Cytobacillus praedii]TCJ00491.1 hypothetical protein E0Y62_26655 [Cytobacillus praedii]
MNLQLAKKRITELQHFVDLVENYETVDFKTHVIKGYATTGSLEKTAAKMNEFGFQVDDREIIKDDIVGVINTKVRYVDELHRLMRLAYRKKIKNNKVELFM